MHNISEHDSEEKWEGNASEYGWVYLFVARNTISINNLLEDCRELIGLEQGWLGESDHLVWALLDVQTLQSLYIYDFSHHAVKLERFWSKCKALRDHTSLLEHVQVVVDCLLPLNEYLIYLEN